METTAKNDVEVRPKVRMRAAVIIQIPNDDWKFIVFPMDLDASVPFVNIIQVATFLDGGDVNYKIKDVLKEAKHGEVS